ncbi:hypothetical protein ACTXT7_002028 [Hymenolepis weldensis]
MDYMICQTLNQPQNSMTCHDDDMDVRIMKYLTVPNQSNKTGGGDLVQKDKAEDCLVAIIASTSSNPISDIIQSRLGPEGCKIIRKIYDNNPLVKSISKMDIESVALTVTQMSRTEIIELFVWCLFWTVGVPHMVKRQYTSEEECSVLSFDISGEKFQEYRETLNEFILQVCSLHPVPHGSAERPMLICMLAITLLLAGEVATLACFLSGNAPGS